MQPDRKHTSLSDDASHERRILWDSLRVGIIRATRMVGHSLQPFVGLGPFVSFVRESGKVGQTAIILGQGLTGSTSVSFNGIPAAFVIKADTFLTATCPAGATQIRNCYSSKWNPTEQLTFSRSRESRCAGAGGPISDQIREIYRQRTGCSGDRVFSARCGAFDVHSSRLSQRTFGSAGCTTTTSAARTSAPKSCAIFIATR